VSEPIHVSQGAQYRPALEPLRALLLPARRDTGLESSLRSARVLSVPVCTAVSTGPDGDNGSPPAGRSKWRVILPGGTQDIW